MMGWLCQRTLRAQQWNVQKENQNSISSSSPMHHIRMYLELHRFFWICILI